MKNLILSIIVSLLAISAFAQQPSVEKSTFGIQTGFLGIWGYNEARLSNSIVLRSEVGLDAALWDGMIYEKSGFLLTPVFKLSPRWYYNLNKRQKKGRRIDGNCGNFLSLTTMFHPDLFVISNYNDLFVYNSISFIPNWGIRRNIGNHFNYEVGAGYAFTFYFKDKKRGLNYGVGENQIYIRLRIGYRF